MLQFHGFLVSVIFNRGRSTGRVFRSAQWPVKRFHGSKCFNFTCSWSALYLIGGRSTGRVFRSAQWPVNESVREEIGQILRAHTHTRLN